jgi:plasmid stabilization system protein ParE
VSLRIEYHELVDTDLEHAWTWYEDQEQGLGDRFLNAIHATVARASRWPNAGTPVLRDDDDEIIERKLPPTASRRPCATGSRPTTG